MTQANPAVPVPGSRRQPVPGAVRVADTAPDATVFATVVLRRASDAAGASADPDDVAKVRAFADGAGIDVVEVKDAARSVRLRGTAASMGAAFGVDLGAYQVDGLTYRGREGSIYVPDALGDAVVAVLGLDNRPSARAHFRIVGAPPATLSTGPTGALAPAARAVSYSPRDIAAAYGFPTGVDGTGQTVAIIELGGGFRIDDLDIYFSDLGLRTPAVEAVPVDGASNSPGDDADGEVMLDIEVVGAVAPGAAIAVYFAPNTTDGFYDGIAAAIHDAARRPSVISISWGQAEAGWTPSQMDAYEALFADAAAANISVYAAAGDNGATDGDNDGSLHVDFPASSPSVVGCGGTKLMIVDGAITDETVWNELDSGNGATGGGVSAHFAAPGYQTGAERRGVPDVAGDADPLTGYAVRVSGQNTIIGGTSAVAPLWAALTALANQRNGTPAGAPHTLLYATPSAFRDITTGDNGGFSAGTGWDGCTGMGSPRGEAVVAAFARVAGSASGGDGTASSEPDAPTVVSSAAE